MTISDLMIENLDDEIIQQFLAKCNRLGCSEAIIIEAFMKRFIDDGGPYTGAHWYSNMPDIVKNTRPYPIIEDEGTDTEVGSKGFITSVLSSPVKKLGVSSAEIPSSEPVFCKVHHIWHDAREGCGECKGG